MNLGYTKPPQHSWFVNSPEETWPLPQHRGWGWLVTEENSDGRDEKRSSNCSREVDGLRRKGGISGFQEWQEGRMRMVGL